MLGTLRQLPHLLPAQCALEGLNQPRGASDTTRIVLIITNHHHHHTTQYAGLCAAPVYGHRPNSPTYKFQSLRQAARPVGLTCSPGGMG